MKRPPVSFAAAKVWRTRGDSFSAYYFEATRQ
jgi:hypothetical protein